MESLPDYLRSLSKPRFLILRLKPIGDTVLLSPVFRNIRKLYPDAIIDVVVYPFVHDVIRHNPYVDNVIVLKRTNRAKLAFYVRSLFRRYDVVIDYINNPTSRAIALFTRSKAAIGNERAPHFIYDYRLTNREAIYSSIRCLKKLEPIGLSTFDDYRPEVFIGGEDLGKVRQFFDGMGGERKTAGIFASAKSVSYTHLTLPTN